MLVIVACSFTQTPSSGDTYPDDEHPPAFLVVGLLLLQSFRLEVLHNVLGREGRHTADITDTHIRVNGPIRLFL